MIGYSNAKINIGLQVLRKRPDGFHDINTWMVPVPFYDILECRVQPAGTTPFQLTQSGITVDGPLSSHLCYKAFEAFNQAVPCPPVRLHLHKQIPVGAGLGGGSSNAAATLVALNKTTGNSLSDAELEKLASTLGSDCPLFIHNVPMLATGRGERLKKREIDLSNRYLVLLHPGFAISTAEAYKLVRPNDRRPALETLLSQPLTDWRTIIKNDFENPLFHRYPLLNELKEVLYTSGALYASMSGSGSSVYGLFDFIPDLPGDMTRYITWQGSPVETGLR